MVLAIACEFALVAICLETNSCRLEVHPESMRIMMVLLLLGLTFFNNVLYLVLQTFYVFNAVLL
jgi:hypothetical protein